MAQSTNNPPDDNGPKSPIRSAQPVVSPPTTPGKSATPPPPRTARLSPLGAPFWDSSGAGADARNQVTATGGAAKDDARRHTSLGLTLMGQGENAQAVEHFRRAISLDPTNAEPHWHLVGAAERLGQHHLIERHLLEVVRLDAAHASAHNALCVWYRQLGRTDVAIYHGATAVALAPRDPKYVADYASLLFLTGETTAAWELIEPMVADPNRQRDRWLAAMYGRLAPAIGHERQALAVIERALAVPGQPAHPSGKPLLLFTAASLLERLGRYDDAFARAREANEMVKTVAPRHPGEAHSRFASGKIEYLTPKRLASFPRATHGDTRPVFIVGMPRSGTSLVEQILASHPQVFGAGELEGLCRVSDAVGGAAWAEGERYPRSLELLSPRRADQLARLYLAGINSLEARAARYVTDKLPTNYVHLELVELLFPNSRVIHCARSPLDTCVSCYMTNFACGNAFALDLGHLGLAYRDYRRLMDHWRRVLRAPILDVRYEDVVLDTETQVRRLLEFLELPWDDRCLRYYENKRAARTASEDQVRRPIYTSSIGRWKSYEPHLGPLIAALGSSAGRNPAADATTAVPSVRV